MPWYYNVNVIGLYADNNSLNVYVYLTNGGITNNWYTFNRSLTTGGFDPTEVINMFAICISAKQLNTTVNVQLDGNNQIITVYGF
jgi:hypothetical protein